MTQPLQSGHYPLEHGSREGETIVLLHGGNVAGWMWEPQVQRLPERHLLTPDLPGYGARVDLVWPGMGGAADDIAALIRERAVDGHAHVVGLSLGGHVAVNVLHRHPGLVRSCTVTGVTAAGMNRLQRALIAPQVPLWRRRWYWAAMSRAFGIPADSRELFVTAGSSVRAETNRRMYGEVAAGTIPNGDFHYGGPVLAVSGGRESRAVQAAFAPLRAALPQLRTWIAPRMHHVWNIEDPDLFTRMIDVHATGGTWPPGSAQ